MTYPVSSVVSIQAQGPLFQKINNAHKDDIHGISKVTPNSFLSGSKDSSLKQFGLDGHMVKVLSMHPACTGDEHPYFYWITALDNFSDGSWVSGQRNGFLQCGDLKKYIYFSKIATDQITGISNTTGFCKERNERRISSIKCLDLYKSLVGIPGGFFEFDYTTGRTVRSFSLGTPDWVYGFCPISPERIAVIHATSLSIFQPTDLSYTKLSTLISYDPAENLEQKPFISSIQAMKESDNSQPTQKVALSCLGGETQIRDLETNQAIHRGLEHTQGVWQSISHTSNTYLSSSDDASIKLWDIRQAETSIHTITGHPGRVSALCLLNEHTLIAGTCATDPYTDPNRAQLFFYDLRKI